MIRRRNGTPRAASLEAERKHCAGETEKRQLLREGDLEDNKMSRSPTLRRARPLTRNSRTPAAEENAGDWSDKDSDGTSFTDGEVDTEKTKATGPVSLVASEQLRKLARIRPLQTYLSSRWCQ